MSRSLLDRVVGAVRGTAAGWNGWFGPGTPLPPTAPADVKGRAFDYPYGINIASGPRTEMGAGTVGFEVLRRFADPTQGGLDLLRLAIETRKNQMAAQPWSIVGRAKNDDGGEKARAIEAMLRRPDGVSTFRAWMRKLLEDHFVIDAPTLFYGNSTGGRPLIEVVDGGTIKRLIENDGRTPLPPLPAYQQFLHGLPANDYLITELGYYPFNERSDRLYGMSYVEQVVGIVTIALNRQLSVLEYYTQGSTPDVMLSVPETWTVTQIKEYAQWWTSELEGQVGARRKARFIPNGMTPTFTKDEILKNEFDEWLARIVCYCFSLPPQALVKETNRATAQTNKQAGQEEGLEPVKNWFKDVMDDVLDRIGAPQLEWKWRDEEITDPKTKAEVISAGTAGKPYMTIEEARDMAGLPPGTPEQLEALREMGKAPDPLGLGGFGDGGEDDEEETDDQTISRGGADDETEKASRGGRSLRSLPPLKRNRKALRRAAKEIHELAEAVLAEARDAAVAAARGANKLTKLSADDANRVLDALPVAPWTDDLREKLTEALARVAEDRSAAAMAQLAPLIDEARYKALLAQANERAVAWAENRVGDLVTEVTDTTRQSINALSARAIDEGLTNDDLADLLEDDFAFSSDRATMIARTETATAETEGTLAGYAESGVVDEKEWSADDQACDECAALDGVRVPLREDFPDGGGSGPPRHPNCECVVVPVV